MTISGQGALHQAGVSKTVVSVVGQFLAPLALLLVVALLNLIHTGVLHASLPPYDETHYYTAAAAVWHGVVPPSDYSPGFELLYALVAFPWMPVDRAYQTMHALLVVLLVCTAFLAVRRLYGSPIATICTPLVSASALAPAITSVYMASAVVMAVALWVVGATPRRAGAALTILVLGTTVRAEYSLVALLGAFLLFPILRYRLRWYIPALATLVVVLSYSALVPANDRGIRGGRMYFAFCQHYGWTQYDLHTHVVPDNKLRYPMDRCDDVMARDFGVARTVPGFIRANPRAFWRHIQHNIDLAPGDFLTMLLLNLPYSLAVSALVVSMCLWLSLLLIALSRLWCHRGRLVIGSAIAPHLYVALSAVGFFPFWLLLRPGADYQFVLLPICVLSLAALMAAARPAFARGRTARRQPGATSNENAARFAGLL